GDRTRPGPQPKVDALPRVPLARAQLDVARLRLAPQVVLRQRRALVWWGGFRADQDQPAVEAPLPKGAGGGPAGDAPADDHERSVLCHDPIVGPPPLARGVGPPQRLGSVRPGPQRGTGRTLWPSLNRRCVGEQRADSTAEPRGDRGRRTGPRQVDAA